ncbi:MAG: hypothetical protein ACE5D0_10010 [Fidelibacterota bacterium]
MREYYADKVYIYPTYMVTVPQYTGESSGNRSYSTESLKNLEHNTHSGTLSRKAKTKLRNALHWLGNASTTKKVWIKAQKRHFNFKLAFVTLTIPYCKHSWSDQRIKSELLHPFIVWMRKQHGLNNFVWKAETQKNGMLHFHICIDIFIHYNQIRKEWNSLMFKSGILDEWIQRNPGKSPPSTEIKAVRKMKDMGAYIGKYFDKSEDDRRSVTGRLWSCSYSLSDKNKLTVFLYSDDFPKFYKPITFDCLCATYEPFYNCYSFPYDAWGIWLKGPVLDLYKSHLFNIRHGTNLLSVHQYQI